MHRCIYLQLLKAMMYSGHNVMSPFTRILTHRALKKSFIVFKEISLHASRVHNEYYNRVGGGKRIYKTDEPRHLQIRVEWSRDEKYTDIQP